VNTCTICGYVLHGARALWSACQACETAIKQLLGDIEQTWPLLSECLEPTRRGAGQRVSGTAAPALPIDGRILDLIGPMGVPTRLYHRYADLALARRIQPATMPPGADHRVRLALYGIRKHLPWGVQGADLTALVRELEKTAGELRSATAGTGTPTVPCPAELPDNGGRCTGKMRYDSDRGTAYCRSCRTALDPSEWLGYWMTLNAAV
jgi:hypothetical protein